MKIRFLCLGRLNKGEENELCKRYEGRLKSLKNSGINSFSIEHISKKELENIMKSKKEKKVIFLSENGQDLDTESFCKKLTKLIAASIKETLFIIGEPAGFKKNLNKESFEEIKKMGIKGCKVEGRDSDNWKLIDAIDVIVHIFHHEQRKNYELEKMWADIIPNQKIFV